VNWPEQKIVGECGVGTTCAWGHNIKMDVNKEEVDWIQMDQKIVQWRLVMYTL